MNITKKVSLPLGSSYWHSTISISKTNDPKLFEYRLCLSSDSQVDAFLERSDLLKLRDLLNEFLNEDS